MKVKIIKTNEGIFATKQTSSTWVTYPVHPEHLDFFKSQLWEEIEVGLLNVYEPSDLPFDSGAQYAVPKVDEWQILYDGYINHYKDFSLSVDGYVLSRLKQYCDTNNLTITRK